VTRQLISPQEYETLLKVLKERIRSAQLQALRSVNSELISLYADIRRMIVEKQQGLDLNKSLPTKPPARDAKRPQLEAMQSFVLGGDRVFRHSMYRLARNVDDLRRIVLGLTVAFLIIWALPQIW
jgi:hypothetical protein